MQIFIKGISGTRIVEAGSADTIEELRYFKIVEDPQHSLINT